METEAPGRGRAWSPGQGVCAAWAWLMGKRRRPGGNPEGAGPRCALRRGGRAPRLRRRLQELGDLLGQPLSHPSDTVAPWQCLRGRDPPAGPHPRCWRRGGGGTGAPDWGRWHALLRSRLVGTQVGCKGSTELGFQTRCQRGGQVTLTFYAYRENCVF